MAYSEDFRLRVVEFIREGNSIKSASELFKIHRHTIRPWLKRGEDLQPRYKGRKTRNCIDLKALEAYYKQHPDAYQYEAAKHFGVGQSTIHYALIRIKNSRKKSHINILRDAPN